VRVLDSYCKWFHSFTMMDFPFKCFSILSYSFNTLQWHWVFVIVSYWHWLWVVLTIMCQKRIATFIAMTLKDIFCNELQFISNVCRFSIRSQLSMKTLREWNKYWQERGRSLNFVFIWAPYRNYFLSSLPVIFGLYVLSSVIAFDTTDQKLAKFWWKNEEKLLNPKSLV